MNNDQQRATAPTVAAQGIAPSANPGGNFDIHPSHGTEGVLARLYRVICQDTTGQRGITLIQWNKLIADYIRDKNQTTLDRMSMRGNLNKEFRRTRMTWRVFCKGMQILKFLCFSVIVDAEFESGEVITAKTFVSFFSPDKLMELFPGEAFQKFLSENLVKKTKGAVVGIPKSSPTQRQSSLSTLLNKLCLAMSHEKGIDLLSWNSMMCDYVQKYHPDISDDKKISVRGNLNKEFRKGAMTWKVFCKALCFLKITKFSITVVAIREDGQEFDSSTVVTFPKVTKAPVFGSYAAAQKKLAFQECSDE
jgi:hypothetical protein